jgi:hypothetical protein
MADPHAKKKKKAELQIKWAMSDAATVTDAIHNANYMLIPELRKRLALELHRDSVSHEEFAALKGTMMFVTLRIGNLERFMVWSIQSLVARC